MKSSIIIPTFGRPKVFERCIRSIELLDNELRFISPFEVIVVNNNNDSKLRSETSKVCKSSKLPILELKTEKALGSVKARNLGIKKAMGEILFFFDDDTIVEKNYFSKAIKDYTDKTVGAVGGSEVKGKISLLHKIFFLFSKPGSVSWSGEIVSNFSIDYPKTIEVKHLHGSNFSIRKKVVDKIGLMDELMEGHYRDETEFVYRVYKSGYKVLFDPSIHVLHNTAGVGGSIDPSKKEAWAYWYHRNTSYFFFKHLYNNNVLKLAAYLIREFFMSLIRSIIYLNIHYLIQMKSIVVGYKLSLKSTKSLSM